MKTKLFLIILLTFFVFYTVLFIGYQNGYYKNKYQKAKELTESQIIEFEKDIHEGKSIDLKEYVFYERRDYTNNLSKNIYRVSLELEKVIDYVVRVTFNNVSKAVNE